MRKLIATAAALAALVAAAPAEASIGHDVKVLKRQVKALRLQLADTDTIARTAEARVYGLESCLGFDALNRYGDPSTQTFGYSYSPDGGLSSFFTTAIDETFAGDPGSLDFLTIDANCTAGGPQAPHVHHTTMQPATRHG